MLSKLFLFFCLFIPFQFALSPQAGVDLALGRVLAIGLFLGWLLNGLRTRKLFIPATLQTWLLLSFIFVGIFSLSWAANLAWAVRKLFFLLSFLPLYFVVADKKIDAPKIVRFLVYGGAGAAVVGLLQFGLQFILSLDPTLNLWRKLAVFFLGGTFSQSILQYSSWLVNISGHTVFRAVALFPDPHMFSLYLGLCLPLALGLYFCDRQKIFLFLAAAILLADFLTFSRGGYVGLLTGLFFAILFSWSRLRTSQRKIIFGLLVLTLFIFTVPNPITRRFISSFDLTEGSNTGRLATWQESLGVIKQYPLGVGLGNYSLAIKPTTTYREPIYAHNLYLDIAAETGILNTLLWLSLILSALMAFGRQAPRDALSMAGIISLIIFSTHSLFETALFSVHVLPLLIIILALSNHQSIENRKRCQQLFTTAENC